MATPATAPPKPEEKKEPKARNAIATKLGLSISEARCKNHMRKVLVPPEQEKAIEAKRLEVKAAKEAAISAGRDFKSDPDYTARKSEMSKLTEDNVRIGGQAAVAVAALCDLITKDALRQAMSNTIEKDHKMVEIGALHENNPEAMAIWPLISDLPSYRDYSPENEAAIKIQTAAQNKALKDAREAAKKAREAEKKAEGGAEGEAKPAEEKKTKKAPKAKPAADGEGSNTTFHTYIENATKVVKLEERYTKMRVSHRLRQVLADLVAQEVARLTLVAKDLIVDMLNVRTVNSDHIKGVVKMIYRARRGTEGEAGLATILANMDEKVRLYQEHQDSEKDRKWKEMDPEKKAAIEAKRVAAEAEKKKTQAEKAKEKAVQMANKARELNLALGTATA